MRLLFLVLFSSGFALSYPLQYQCKNKQFRHISSSDQSNGANQQNNLSECLSELNLISSVLKLDNSTYSQIDTTTQCIEEIKAITPESYIKNEELVLTYPFYSDYMYAMGCRGLEGKPCQLIDKKQIDKVIEDSLLMNIDPYITIALALMEGTSQKGKEGNQGIGTLYLDPIGVMGALGCSAKSVSKKSNALNSYGNKYQVNAQLISNSEINNKITRLLSRLPLIEKETLSTTYFCYDVKGKGHPTLSNQIQENSCCLKIKAPLKVNQGYYVSTALKYHFISKILKRPFRKKNQAYWRLQRFNGYSNLMGAGEGVSNWRAGVNYYKNPAYGFQAMDFILNSLVSNSYISDKINHFLENSQSSYQSALCIGKIDGEYTIDTNKYFNMHKKSERLENINKKFKQGVSFQKLSSREKKVTKNEILDTSQDNPFIQNTISPFTKRQIIRNLTNKYPLSFTQNYITEVLPTHSYTDILNYISREYKVLKVDFVNTRLLASAYANPYFLVDDHEFEKAYRYYFENLYYKRNQIGLSSSYPWRRFTSDEIESLVLRFAPKS